MKLIIIIVTVFVAISSADEAPNAPAAAAASQNTCIRRNEYIQINGQCDAYMECRDYVPVQKLCPEGLHYDPSVAWPIYPCGYPSDVTCPDHSAIQPVKSTPDCPHQYGYFPSPVAAPNDCGQYRMCILGKPYEMVCPVGLAFNFASDRCDWPDLVPTCDVEKYLGFQCPPASFDESGNPIKTNHSYKDNCYAFYSCLGGKPRLLSCDSGFAFDSVSGECVDADSVSCASNPQPQSAVNQPNAS
ncbi:protein obstructor-E-like [Zerene cesonia]|uniref:protein obstructor-E-like n=1 Tax=Zerene cesonia TaxID=33412 RepID=UPI0018E53456|nr:protein obstructor-E-like [Zerene cesonia]